MNKKPYFLVVALFLLSAVVVVASAVYLIKGQMIPGLIPFGTALLMIPVWMLCADKFQRKSMTLMLFIAAIALNVVAGVLQIMNAI